MLISYTTPKLYFAYPIFVIGYEDDQFGANVTTCSSSYSLGDMFCFGLGATGNAAAQIRRSKRCTINFLAASHLRQIEYAGFHHAGAKLSSGLFPHEETASGPILTDAFAAVVVAIDSWQAAHGAINFTGTIERRLVQDSMVTSGRLDVEKIVPPLFAGDGHQRVYRTLDDQVSALGDFQR